MEEILRQESEKLARSWLQHDSGWLKDYLVAGVEDPRLNAQSILSRHFLLEALFGERFRALMDCEHRFALAVGWLLRVSGAGDCETFAAILYALRRRADNAEGIGIPDHVAEEFSKLPALVCGVQVPNYLDEFLNRAAAESVAPNHRARLLGTFVDLWRELLSRTDTSAPERPLSTLEPACGSANDYRFLDACGLAHWIDYTGFDLCPKNVENARSLFPQTRFEVGNVFEIAAPDRAYQLGFVHDLFEHLSLPGLETAVREICRVTRAGLCVGFFNMDEIAEHLISPLEEYHWNTLSMARMRELFSREGFEAQVIHIGAFLGQRFGCQQTHNPNAYTFRLWRTVS